MNNVKRGKRLGQTHSSRWNSPKYKAFNKRQAVRKQHKSQKQNRLYGTCFPLGQKDVAHFQQQQKYIFCFQMV